MATAARLAAEVPAAEAGAGPPRATRPFLVFDLPGAACALPLAALREVVPMALLSRPPGLPSLLEGFLNLGGTAVPVLRLARLFGLPDVVPGLYTPLLILRQPEDQLALLVESVRGVAPVAPDDVRPVVGTVCFNDCVEGEVTLGDGAVHLLAPDRLLLEKERQCLAELQAAEQERLRNLEEAPP